MGHSTGKGNVLVGQVAGLATDSGATAVATAEVLIERVIGQVTDAVTRIRRKQPLISITLVVVKNNNLGSPLGQVGTEGDADGHGG